MLNGYEISMLLMIAASFVYMMWRLVRAIEQEQKDTAQQKKIQDAGAQENPTFSLKHRQEQ